MGITTDVIQTRNRNNNQVFLSFFDQIFQTYAVSRSKALYTGNPGSSAAGMKPPTIRGQKLELENKVRKSMGLEEV